MTPNHHQNNKISANRRLLMGIGIWIMLMIFLSPFLRSTAPSINYTQFKQFVSNGKVAKIRVSGDQVKGEFREAVQLGDDETGVETTVFRTVIPSIDNSELLKLLESQNTIIDIESEKQASWVRLLIGLLPWLLIIGFFVYSSRALRKRMPGGQGLFGFGKSKAKLYDRSKSSVHFEDAAGLTNAKRELEEIVAFLKDPSRFMKLGGKLPRGILLAGPPGTGKTLLARATAGEADVPFYSISGSEFIEMFVGVGASRVRDMFERAKKEAPVIIFIDEIDSIGRVRGTGLGGGHDEREQTLNQILAEMDGFSPHESVIVLAATNRPDVLDPALVRPGRFDRRITLELPDRKSREAILNIHAKDVPLAEDVRMEMIAGMTVGFSGADLENLLNEAAIIAARDNEEKVRERHFDEALDKIRMGPEKEDFLSDREKRIVACHEAGHAIVAKLLPGTDPVHKVTIIPHGQALGVTEQVPEEDRRNLSRDYLTKRIAILMGGRVAEQIVIGDVSSGAGNDLKQATEMARRMICQWGMSDRLGPVTFPQGEKHPFLGKDIAEARNYSEKTARIIDTEIQTLVRNMEEKARELITENRDKLDHLAEALMTHETLEEDAIDAIVHPETAN